MSGTRAGIVLFGCCVASMLFGAAAASASRSLVLQPVGQTATFPVATDARWAAYEVASDRTRIIDTRTGHATVRPDPPGCTGLAAVGDGQLLYGCGATGAALENASTGTLTAVSWPPEPETVGGDREFFAVGATWVEGGEFAYKRMRRIFVDWHTGAIVRPQESLDQFADLDATKPLQRYCAPYESVRTPLGGPAPGEFDGSELPVRLPFVLTVNKHSLLMLNRCGSRRHDMLGAGPSYFDRPSWFNVGLGGNTVTWETEESAGLTQLLSRGQSWHGPLYRLRARSLPNSSRTSTTTSATEWMVFQTMPYKTSGGEPIEVYSARIPRRSQRH